MQDPNQTLGSAVASIAREKALRDAEAAGRPPPSEVELDRIAEEAERKNVYGFDYKTDRHGRPIQQGVGAWPHHVTPNSMAGIRKYEGEVAYQAALKKLWRDAPDRARKIGLPEPARASA
jgi:hypothetical protein